MTIGATAIEPTRRESDLPRSAGRPLNLARSLAHLAEARKLVPGVTNSLMKRPEMFALDGLGALAELGDAP